MNNCEHIGKFIGLCLVNPDTGFCQQLFECVKCGLKGQIPTMFHPSAIHNFHRTDDCIVIRMPWNEKKLTN